MTTTTHPSSVIIPIIRRVMPSIIANQIIGVQPMTFPVQRKWNRVQWPHNRFRVDPAIYRHFLRLNNRRRTQGPGDFEQAGYPTVSLTWFRVPEANDWCRSNLAPHSWVRRPYYLTWWFASNEDAAMFSMCFR